MKKYLFTALFLSFMITIVPAVPACMHGRAAVGKEHGESLPVPETELSKEKSLASEPYKVLDVSTGKVLLVPVREYVIGAVCAEMPANFGTEALKAQAVAAHTYAERQRLIARKEPRTDLNGADFSNDTSKYQGYFNDEKATQAAYFDGYLKTGDLGYMDEDGFVYFKTRKKRVIKVNGVAVFPHEIEEVIMGLSGIKTVCVVQIPDEKTVNAAKAYVVSNNKDPERIKNECRKKLISWAIPREVEFVKELPMTRYNKVNYMKVQEMENEKRAA